MKVEGNAARNIESTARTGNQYGIGAGKRGEEGNLHVRLPERGIA
jgi:hypothetical protein